MDDHGVQPSPSGSPAPQEQEIVLTFNHGGQPSPAAPVAPGGMPPPATPLPAPGPVNQHMIQNSAPYIQQPTIPQQTYRQIGVPGQPAAVTPPVPGMQPLFPAAAVPFGAQAPVEAADSRSHRMLFLIIALIVAIMLGGGVYAAVALLGNKMAGGTNNTAINTSCTPPAGTTATKQRAELAYIRFTTAMRQKNQACANALSSSYFEQSQRQIFTGSNGQWITKSEGGMPSLAVRLATAPSSFTLSLFTSSAYTRPATTGSDGTSVGSATNLPSGITLSYPVTDASTKVKSSLVISFISANDKVVVDFMELAPTPTTTTGSASNSPASSGSPASVTNQETAQSDILAIDADLGSYFSAGTSSYPSTLDTTAFIDAGIGIDTSTLSPPAGTYFIYTPTPSGCATAAHNCTQFTLSANNSGDHSVIYSTQSATN
jgi:hypothetical protein